MMIKLIKCKFLLFVLLSQGVGVITSKESKATESSKASKCLQQFDSHSLREEIRKRVLNKSEEFIQKYKGQKGYVLLASELNIGMAYLYHEVFSYLKPNEIKRLKWKEFQGTVKEYKSLSRYVLDDNGNIKSKFKGSKGYVRVAIKFFAERMRKTFINVSAVLSKKYKSQLDWQQFPGTVKEYKSLKRYLLDGNGNIKSELKGSKGYALVASKRRFSGNMKIAFQNVSAVLSEKQMKQLAWQEFHGTVKESKSLKRYLLDINGNIKEEIKGPKGYALVASKHRFSGNMQIAFQNVSAVLSEKQMEQLDWQQFQGRVKNYDNLRRYLLDDTGNIKSKFKGSKGYALVASNRRFSGNMQKAFLNVSAVLPEKQMKQLDWHQFHGTVKDYAKLRGYLLDINGNIKEEIKGLDGYVNFAIKHFSGNLLITYMNVSAVLGGAAIMKEMGIEWKQLKGSVYQYQLLVELFKNSNPLKLQGRKGQKYVAKTIHLLNLRQVYDNVSSLRKPLLGHKPFKSLNWNRNN